MTDRLYALLCPLWCVAGGVTIAITYIADNPVAALVAAIPIPVLVGISWLTVSHNARLIAEQNRLIAEMWTRINKMDEESNDG